MSKFNILITYSIIFETTPAPIVRPPSLIAKRIPCSIATGQITAFTGDDGSNVEMVMPGDRIKMTGELICPVAIEQGMRFAIREGGRTIGAGVVSKIIE